ncbi:MAG: ShlB/FhaC/HecB family hemolysin secretion/activation protein [Pseudomonadota bacterium]
MSLFTTDQRGLIKKATDVVIATLILLMVWFVLITVTEKSLAAETFERSMPTETLNSESLESETIQPSLSTRSQSLVPISSTTPVSTANGSQKKSETKFLVVSITLENVREYPEYGVTKEKLDELVLEYQKKYSFEMTLDDLHSLADSLTVYLKEAGLMFSQVILPPQELNNGEIILRVEEAKLGEVIVSDYKRYNPNVISGPFNALSNQVIHRESFTKAIDEVKSLPGLDIFSFFSVGKNPGETRLNIKVIEERDWLASVRLDNHGTESTGLWRAYGQLSILNPMGQGDELNFGILQSLASNNATYGEINYLIPAWNLGQRWYLQAETNRFSVGREFEIFDISGEAQSLRFGLKTENNIFGGHGQFSTLLNYTDSTIKSDLIGEFIDSEDELYFLTFDAFVQKSLGLGMMSFSNAYKAGQQTQQTQPIDGLEIDEVFGLVQAGARFLTHPISSFAGLSHQWGLSVDGQWTQDSLQSVLQSSVSGPSKVRALPTGYFSAERTGIASLTWSIKSEQKTSQRDNTYFLFVDGGYGQRLELDSVSTRGRFIGAGIGWSGRVGNLGWQSTLATTLDQVLTQDGTSLGLEEPSAQFFVSFEYAFGGM